MKRQVLGVVAVSLMMGGLLSSCGKPASGAAVIEPATTSASSVSSSTATPSAPAPVLVEVPSLVGMSPAEATATLKEAGFTVKVNGATTNPEHKVVSQLPSPGKVKEGSRISITVGESAEQKQAREAAEAAAAAAAAAEEKAKAEAAAAQAAAEEKAKAEAAAAAAAADADRSTYQKVDARTWALVEKDPAAHIGEKFVLYGKIIQFDSATGTSAFLARTGATEQEYSYKYETNTLVVAPDAAQVADLVEGDLVRIYVKIQGSFSYDTQAGGNTTVPKVQVLAHDLRGHDD
jgi:hypothetical protein